jgi:hypothetical protein
MKRHAGDLLSQLRLLGAIGASNAVYGAKLAKAIGAVNEKSIQTAATELRHNGYMIGANDLGFFICETYDEAYDYVKSLERRVAGANKTINSFWNAMNDKWPVEQTNFL